MTKVIHLASRRAGNLVHTSAQSLDRSPTTLTPERQIAIEKALALELYNIRQNEAPSNIHSATVRAVQAAAVRQQAFNAQKNASEWLTRQSQAAVENALSMALYFTRQSHATPANLWAATARTNRALTLLKQASESALQNARA